MDTPSELFDFYGCLPSTPVTSNLSPIRLEPRSVKRFIQTKASSPITPSTRNTDSSHMPRQSSQSNKRLYQETKYQHKAFLLVVQDLPISSQEQILTYNAIQLSII